MEKNELIIVGYPRWWSWEEISRKMKKDFPNWTPSSALDYDGSFISFILEKEKERRKDK